MHEHYISFLIDDVDKIVIELEESVDKVHCCYEAPVVLIHDNKRFDLSSHSVRDFLTDLRCFAQQLMSNTLQLHKSITQEDIGFLFNEDLQYKPGLFIVQKNGRDSWIGYNYLLIMSYREAVWFYNAPDDAIMCEVTPRYPFSYRNYEKDPNYIPYKTWIKNYKPYFTTKASPHFIAEWITQSDTILKTIEENIQKWHEDKSLSS